MRLAFLALTACGGSVGDPNSLVPAKPAPVATVSVVPGTQTITAGTTYLSAVLRDSTGYVLVGRGVVWASSDSTIAIIGASGYVFAAKPGQATITATSEGVSGSAIVTVPQPPTVAAVQVSPDSVAVETGQLWPLSYALRDSAGHVTTSSQATTWSSNDPATVTVSTSGVVTGVAVGTALVTATNGSKSGTATVRVFPTMPVGSLILTPDSVTVVLGAYQFFTVVVKDVAGNRVFNRAVIWSTSNGSNAQVASQSPYDATVATLSTGTVFAIASSGGVQGTARIVIVPPPVVAQLVVTPASAPLVVGRTLILSATMRDAANAPVFVPITWTSSDSVKATLSGGAVTALAAGTVTITATGGGKSAQATLTLTAPVALSIAALGTGRQNACAITTTGDAYCWGLGMFGVRGDGAASDTLAHPVPGRVSGTQTWGSVAVSDNHACAVASGTLFCWGLNTSGQLGVAGAPSCLLYGAAHQCSAVPLAVLPNAISVRQVSAAATSTCAVTTGNLVYCWGDNANGQLGTGSVTSSSTPLAIAGNFAISSIATGRLHVCGLAADGKVLCWGSNEFGQLGAPTRGTCTDAFQRTAGCSSVPLLVPGGLTFDAITAGGDHTCGLTATGVAYCWGSNANGELGNGTLLTTDIPTQIPGGIHFIALSAGVSHTCGLATGGIAYCWGSNANGQIGIGSVGTTTPSPAVVGGGMTFEEISAGSTHTCAVTAAHVAYCWGNNSLGQLGTGNTKPNLAPMVAVSGP